MRVYVTMSQKLNCTQAYQVMLHFFDRIMLESGDDEITVFAGFGILYSIIPGECPKTVDAAKWHDWMDGLKKIVGDNSITYEFELTFEQGYAAAYEYILLFCHVGAERSVHELCQLLNPDNENVVMKVWLYKHWLQSITYILQQDIFENKGVFFNPATKVTQRESFLILKIFLDIFCQENNNQELNLLVQKSRLQQRDDYWADIPNILEPKIWDIWHQSIEIFAHTDENQLLDLLIVYKVIPYFLIYYFDNKQLQFIHKMIAKLLDYEYDSPSRYPYWNRWITAVGIANIEQMEICYDIISIHTPISHVIACQIIQAWFSDNQSGLDVNLAQNITYDSADLEKIIESIKKKPRSYLLLDDEITVLEAYHAMLMLLELENSMVDSLQVDEKGRPIGITVLLDWIRIAELVIKNNERLFKVNRSV
jgi:hypothetical protein